MSPRTNATISPDRSAGDPDLILGMVVQSRSSSRAKKRRQEEADTPDGNGGIGPAAKVARLASAMSLASAMTDEETKEQEGDGTDAPLTTEKIMNLLKDLWSDDKCVIERALKEIASIGFRDHASRYENEDKMRVLGGHTAVFQLLQKHVDCLEIQDEGMCALGNLSLSMPTKKLLGEIGCVEVILATMEKYLDSERVQHLGCYVIGRLVDSMEGNAERVEKYGGIAVVIAAMKAHPNSEELQNHGCIALLYMSGWEDYRPLIVEAGGASAIAFGVEKYGADNAQLRKNAYTAMRLLFKE
jgi:hypothetical protein